MLKTHSITALASCLACLAIALAANTAIAQQEEQQDQQSQSDQSQQQDQANQREQQERQRVQQARQREEQARQSDQQARQRDREDRSDTPYSERGEDARQQWQRDRQQFGRDQQQFGRDQVSRDAERSARERGGDEAGLGVNVNEARDGVIVTQIHQGSPAQEMGLRRGDVITRIDGERIESAQQFVAQIRQKDPGEEIEIDIERNNEDETISGELRSRRDVLVIRSPQRGRQWWGQPDRDASQTGYQEDRYSQSRISRSGNIDSQLNQIERQVNQLGREIEELRYALRDLRQQSGSRETTARYDEPQNRRFGEGRISERIEQGQSRERQYFRDGQGDFDSDRGEQRSRQIDSDQDRETRTYRSGQDRDSEYEEGESSGGETGEARLRPDRN